MTNIAMKPPSAFLVSGDLGLPNSLCTETQSA